MKFVIPVLSAVSQEINSKARKYFLWPWMHLQSHCLSWISLRCQWNSAKLCQNEQQGCASLKDLLSESEKMFLWGLENYHFVSTGGNPQSFCFKTLCSMVKHFFQASPYCFHLGTPILLEGTGMRRQYAEATSKMIVIMARGHFRLCEWIKAAFQKQAFSSPVDVLP